MTKFKQVVGRGTRINEDFGKLFFTILDFVENKLFKQLRNIQLIPSQEIKYKRALIIREVFEGNNNYMKNGTNIRKVLNKLNEINFNTSKDKHAFGDLYESILKELQSAGKSGEFCT